MEYLNIKQPLIFYFYSNYVDMYFLFYDSLFYFSFIFNKYLKFFLARLQYDLIKDTASRINSRGITLYHPIPAEYIISRSLPERSLGVPPCLKRG